MPPSRPSGGKDERKIFNGNGNSLQLFKPFPALKKLLNFEGFNAFSSVVQFFSYFFQLIFHDKLLLSHWPSGSPQIGFLFIVAEVPPPREKNISTPLMATESHKWKWETVLLHIA